MLTNRRRAFLLLHDRVPMERETETLLPRASHGERQAEGGGNGSVAVAIDKDIGSQFALKRALEIFKCQSFSSMLSTNLYLLQVQCLDVILEDTDTVKALLEYVSNAAIETLILGASSRLGFIRRFVASDIPSNVSKGAPDFCSVYVISKKTKITSMRMRKSQAAPGIRSERVESSYLLPSLAIFILFPLPFFWFAVEALFKARKDSAQTS